MRRKRLESAPSMSVEWHFLITLNEQLRPLKDPVEIQEVAVRLIGEHLHASRVNYALIDGDEFVVSRCYAETLHRRPGEARSPVSARPSSTPAAGARRWSPTTQNGSSIHDRGARAAPRRPDSGVCRRAADQGRPMAGDVRRPQHDAAYLDARPDRVGRDDRRADVVGRRAGARGRGAGPGPRAGRRSCAG